MSITSVLDEYRRGLSTVKAIYLCDSDGIVLSRVLDDSSSEAEIFLDVISKAFVLSGDQMSKMFLWNNSRVAAVYENHQAIQLLLTQDYHVIMVAPADSNTGLLLDSFEHVYNDMLLHLSHLPSRRRTTGHYSS